MTKYINQKEKAYPNALIIFSLLICVLYNYIPTITEVVPTIVRYGMYFVILGACVWLCIRDGLCQSFYASLLKLIGIFSLVMMINAGQWHQSGTELISFLFQNFLFWYGLLFTPYLRELKDSEKRIVEIGLFVTLLFSTLTTIIGNYLYPEASRVLATGEHSYRVDTYNRMNIGGYGYVYSVVVLLPYILYRIQFGRRKTERTAYLVLLVLIAVMCLITQYSIACMMCLAIVLASMVMRSNRKALWIMALLAVGVVALATRSMLAEWLSDLAKMMLEQKLEQTAERVLSFRDMILGVELSGDAALRGSMYAKGVNAFLDSPIWGNLIANNHIGGHSELFNLLGGVGLFGTALFAMLCAVHVYHINDVPNRMFRGYAWISFASFFVLLGVNTVFTSIPIGTSAFLCMTLFSHQTEEGSAPMPEAADGRCCRYIRSSKGGLTR